MIHFVFINYVVDSKSTSSKFNLIVGPRANFDLTLFLIRGERIRFFIFLSVIIHFPQKLEKYHVGLKQKYMNIVDTEFEEHND